MDQSFGNLGAGGSSSGGSNSAKAAAASSSFLQLPLSTASPAGGGVAYYGAPLALLHHQAAAGPSSSQSPYGRHAPPEISPAEAEAIKAKIVAHPQYSALLAAYLDCQKVGAFFAPPAPAPCLLARSLARTHTSPHRRPSKSRILSLICRARFA
jgi:hypothetical protein